MLISNIMKKEKCKFELSRYIILETVHIQLKYLQCRIIMIKMDVFSFIKSICRYPLEM